MHYSTIVSFLGLAAVAAAAPTVTKRQTQTFNVAVGFNSETQTDALIFDPPFIQGAKRGDLVHLVFHKGNHTFTESTFAHPCHKSPTAQFDTNFGNVITSDSLLDHPFDFTISDSSSRTFYCKQKNFTPEGHCHQGMVFGININQDQFNQLKGAAVQDGLVQAIQ